MLLSRFKLPLTGWVTVFKAVKNADIVHLMGHWYFINVMAYLAIRFYKKPYVVCPAGALPLFGRSKKIKKAFNILIGNSIINNANGWIAVTKEELTHFKDYGIPKKYVTVIPNGVNKNDFSLGNEASFRARHGLSSKPILLFMGRLNLIKGPDILLDAYIKEKDNLQDYQLVFAGPDEGLLSSLVSTRDKNELTDRVHFVGFLNAEDKATVYNSSELLIIPSRQEAMSIVAIEAGICGLPVLLTDQCAFSQVREVSPLMEVPVDVNLLAKGMIDILKPDVLAAIKPKWKEFVVNNYSWGSLVKCYTNLYSSILK